MGMGIKVKDDRLDWSAPCPICDARIWENDRKVMKTDGGVLKYRCPGCKHIVFRSPVNDFFSAWDPYAKEEIQGEPGEVRERDVSIIMFAIRWIMKIVLVLLDRRNNRKYRRMREDKKLFDEARVRRIRRIRANFENAGSN